MSKYKKALQDIVNIAESMDREEENGLFAKHPVKKNERLAVIRGWEGAANLAQKALDNVNKIR